MALESIKQHIFLKTKYFGQQELRFHFVNHNTIEIGTKVLNLHYLKERLENQSFAIWLNDITPMAEMFIELGDKTFEGVLVPMNRTALQYRPYEDYYKQP